MPGMSYTVGHQLETVVENDDFVATDPKDEIANTYFCNENPTLTEIQMFRYYGLYRIEETERYTRYAPVHLPSEYNDFPKALSVSSKNVEWNSDVFFQKESETVSIHLDNLDVMGQSLILDRCTELNFK